MTQITGTCQCGTARYSADGPARFAIRCYCEDCRRASGGGHLPQVAVEAASLSISGPTGAYTSRAPSGSDVTLIFCKTCGSPMTKATTRAPELVFLTAGTLDDPGVVPEMREVFEDSRLAWDLTP